MIYIVEDDQNIRQMESYALKTAGFETAECEDASQLYALLKESLPQLIVLDIMLPGEDGLAILNRLKKDRRLCTVPVVMVTAKTQEMDIVRALDAGADDYIAKPFGIMEFISRIKAVLRRMDQPDTKQLVCGGIVISDDSRAVTANGQPVELTFKEYELLKLLMGNPGMVFSRDKIMDKVWGTDYQGETRTVDMHIKTLRKKLGECAHCVKTIRNVGYKIDEQ